MVCQSDFLGNEQKKINIRSSFTFICLLLNCWLKKTMEDKKKHKEMENNNIYVNIQTISAEK